MLGPSEPATKRSSAGEAALYIYIYIYIYTYGRLTLKAVAASLPGCLNNRGIACIDSPIPYALTHAAASVV